MTECLSLKKVRREKQAFLIPEERIVREKGAGFVRACIRINKRA